MQVALRCFYTAIHNNQLYPSFTRASGRAGKRYANIFRAFTDEFEIRLLVIMMDLHHQPTVQMSGYVEEAIARASIVMVRSVRTEKANKDMQKNLKEIKKTNSEAGLCIIVY